jgi:hypothetical protein
MKMNLQNSNGMSNIEAVVMARVRRVFLMRKFLNPTALKVYSATLLYVGLVSMVSIANVYANMPSLMTPNELFTFMLRAMLNTEIVVQCALVGFFGVVAFFVRDMVRMLKESKILFTRVQV